MIKSLLKGKPALEVECAMCGSSFESRYNRGQLIKYEKEFGEYENHVTDPCANCGAVTVINMNLPAEELEEPFFDAVGMPEAERAERRAIKDLKKEFTFQ